MQFTNDELKTLLAFHKKQADEWLSDFNDHAYWSGKTRDPGIEVRSMQGADELFADYCQKMCEFHNNRMHEIQKELTLRQSPPANTKEGGGLSEPLIGWLIDRDDFDGL
jgi:hypothetical protein